MATTYATSPLEWRMRLRVSFSVGDVHGRVPVTDRILFLRKTISSGMDISRGKSRKALEDLSVRRDRTPASSRRGFCRQ